MYPSDLTAYQNQEYLEMMQSHGDLMDVYQEIQEQQKKISRRNTWARMLVYVALWMWGVAFMLAAASAIPQVWYAIFPNTSNLLAERLGVTVDVEKSEFGEILYEEPVYVPPYDPSLPKENRVIIPEIGVDTVIGEGNDWEEILREGSWRVPELGTPENRSLPTIIAAHRFGYLVWTNQFRRENSFYNLPRIENGDTIEIIWNQRKYIYEVYEGYTDTEIQTYDADLILYTCEILNSDRRIFRYARLVEP